MGSDFTGFTHIASCTIDDLNKSFKICLNKLPPELQTILNTSSAAKTTVRWLMAQIVDKHIKIKELRFYIRQNELYQNEPIYGIIVVKEDDLDFYPLWSSNQLKNKIRENPYSTNHKKRITIIKIKIKNNSKQKTKKKKKNKKI